MLIGKGFCLCDGQFHNLPYTAFHVFQKQKNRLKYEPFISLACFLCMSLPAASGGRGPHVVLLFSLLCCCRKSLPQRRSAVRFNSHISGLMVTHRTNTHSAANQLITSTKPTKMPWVLFCLINYLPRFKYMFHKATFIFFCIKQDRLNVKTNFTG